MYDDLTEFQRWAAGNLVDNRNRGIFAEWLVSQALDAIGETDVRKEWDAGAVRFGGVAIEVKASGLSQTWNQSASSTPRFDVAPQKTAWNADTDDWVTYDPPQRTADVYVFCLHKALPATNKNVKDTNTWVFWVVATRTLDEVVGGQKTLGLKKLDSLAPRIPWNEIRAAVDDCQSA